MEFYPRGASPPLRRIIRDNSGEAPEPDMRWSWVQKRFQVSYDGGYSWYDRETATKAEKRASIQANLSRAASSLRGR